MNFPTFAVIVCFSIAVIWVVYAYAQWKYSQGAFDTAQRMGVAFDVPQRTNPRPQPENGKRKAEHLLGMYYETEGVWARISRVNMQTNMYVCQRARLNGDLGHDSIAYSIDNLKKLELVTYEQFTEMATSKLEIINAWQDAPPPGEQINIDDGEFFYMEDTTAQEVSNNG